MSYLKFICMILSTVLVVQMQCMQMVQRYPKAIEKYKKALIIQCADGDLQLSQHDIARAFNFSELIKNYIFETKLPIRVPKSFYLVPISVCSTCAQSCATKGACASKDMVKYLLGLTTKIPEKNIDPYCFRHLCGYLDIDSKHSIRNGKIENSSLTSSESEDCLNMAQLGLIMDTSNDTSLFDQAIRQNYTLDVPSCHHLVTKIDLSNNFITTIEWLPELTKICSNLIELKLNNNYIRQLPIHAVQQYFCGQVRGKKKY